MGWNQAVWSVFSQHTNTLNTCSSFPIFRNRAMIGYCNADRRGHFVKTISDRKRRFKSLDSVRDFRKVTQVNFQPTLWSNEENLRASKRILLTVLWVLEPSGRRKTNQEYARPKQVSSTDTLQSQVREFPLLGRVNGGSITTILSNTLRWRKTKAPLLSSQLDQCLLFISTIGNLRHRASFASDSLSCDDFEVPSILQVNGAECSSITSKRVY